MVRVVRDRGALAKGVEEGDRLVELRERILESQVLLLVALTVGFAVAAGAEGLDAFCGVPSDVTVTVLVVVGVDV